MGLEILLDMTANLHKKLHSHNPFLTQALYSLLQHLVGQNGNVVHNCSLRVINHESLRLFRPNEWTIEDDIFDNISKFLEISIYIYLSLYSNNAHFKTLN